MAEKNSKDEAKVLSIAEQEVLAKEEVQKILKLAKEKGKVTIEEINESLSQEVVAVSVLDSFMQSLEANGVVIAEHSDARASEEKEEFLSEVDKEEDEDDEDAPAGEDVKGSDPVRLYLRK